jgi:protoporphyrinogen oxidase
LLSGENVQLNTEIVEIDTEEKKIKFANANTIQYDTLISTIPIDVLIQKIIKPTKRLDVENLLGKYGLPKYSTSHVIGILR